MAANSPVAYRNEVSYEWERAQHLRDLRAGRMSREELCDADFLLRAAAEHHGVDLHKPCPICESQMRLTRWVYGESLGRRAGSARSESEIAELAGEGLEFTVHTVEVCPACRWNHLLRAATVYALE
ncbi:DUF5318 domain-containing protein [Corynebacterium singulare]|uniref:DUF5318 domain-containing protein n=1 Tax=Corynebacterium singulare TaxID=161899 RepID=UPI0021B3CE78|nr:DUF5318 domain-containing protein [Corynebacterium singulare]